MITHAIPTLTVNGEDQHAGLDEFAVSADLDGPDTAEITLNNEDTDFSTKFKPGDEVIIKIAMEHDDKPKTIFKGKIMGIHPVFENVGPKRVTLHAINDLHKLAQKKKTRTYVDQTDKQIIEKIAQENGLSADFGSEPPNIKHPHIHQFNQSDLAFIRTRAARCGREAYVQDKKLFFRKPDKSDSPKVKLYYDVSGDEGLESFAPRMSTAGQVKKVTVRCWDPTKKDHIVGEATAENSPLGGESGATLNDNAELEVHNVSLRTKEEADEVAKSILQDRMMNFITGSAVARGNADIKPGAVVEIKCGDKRFSGKYYVVSVKHTFGDSGAGGTEGELGGFKTRFEFKRDAAGS